MLARYHREITVNALSSFFSPIALETIIQANLHQDDLLYLLGGYPHFHFDDNAFDRTFTYLEAQRNVILEALRRFNPVPAWQAFGHITHALQDFYSHTNYIQLWLEAYSSEEMPDSSRVDPLLPHILNHHRLFSARSVLLLEVLSMVPVVGKRLLTWFPPDVHARMNLDQPSTGSLFPFAMEAAQKRTSLEYKLLSEKITEHLGISALSHFVGYEFKDAS